MKNLNLIMICFIMLAGKVSAQSSDKKAADKETYLRMAGVDTIIAYHPYCVGAFYSIAKGDTARCHDMYNIQYLFWADKGINYVQKFDDCYNYEPVANKSAEVGTLVRTHYEELKKEEIKKVEHMETLGGKSELLVNAVDHSCHADFDIYIGLKKVSKYIDFFDLDTQFVYDLHDRGIKYPNINYAYNQATYLKKLKDVAEKEIAVLTFKQAN